MFNSETGRAAGLKGGRIGGRIGGRATSEKKRQACIQNMTRAKEAGLMTGRPASGCTCGQSTHLSVCRVYLAQKKRESRERQRAFASHHPKQSKLDQSPPVKWEVVADDVWLKSGTVLPVVKPRKKRKDAKKGIEPV